MPNDPRGEREPVVLIVDDHPDTAELLAEYLRFHEIRALRAENVAEAREILAREDGVGVVVTDYAMPGEDGISFLRSLRGSPRWSELPVIVVSGHDHDGQIARAARQQGAAFIAKPYKLATLVEALRDALARGGAELPDVVERAGSSEVAPGRYPAGPIARARVQLVEARSPSGDPRRDPDG